MLEQLKASQETFELSLLDERNRAKADLEKRLRKAREAAVASGTQYEVEVSRLSACFLYDPYKPASDSDSDLSWLPSIAHQQASHRYDDQIRQRSIVSMGRSGKRPASSP